MEVLTCLWFFFSLLPPPAFVQSTSACKECSLQPLSVCSVWSGSRSFIFLTTKDTNDPRSEQKSHFGTSCTKFFPSQGMCSLSWQIGFPQRWGFERVVLHSQEQVFKIQFWNPEGKYHLENILSWLLLMWLGCLQFLKSILDRYKCFFLGVGHQEVSSSQEVLFLLPRRT